VRGRRAFGFAPTNGGRLGALIPAPPFPAPDPSRFMLERPTPGSAAEAAAGAPALALPEEEAEVPKEAATAARAARAARLSIRASSSSPIGPSGPLSRFPSEAMPDRRLFILFVPPLLLPFKVLLFPALGLYAEDGLAPEAAGPDPGEGPSTGLVPPRGTDRGDLALCGPPPCSLGSDLRLEEALMDGLPLPPAAPAIALASTAYTSMPMEAASRLSLPVSFCFLICLNCCNSSSFSLRDCSRALCFCRLTCSLSRVTSLALFSAASNRSLVLS